MTKLYNSSVPVPNSVNPGGSDYAYSSITPQTFRDVTTREDWKISSKDDLFVRYTWQRYTKSTNSPLANNLGREAEGRWIQLASIGWNHIINANTNLDITYGGTSFKSTCCGYPGYDSYKPSDVGLPSYTDAYAQATAPAFEQLPVLSFVPPGSGSSTYTGMGHYNAGQVPNTTRDSALRANLTHVMGRHTIRAGAEWRLQNWSQQINGNVSGTYNFDSTYTQENNGSDSAFAAQNFALSYAAFLMGIHTTASASQTASQSFQSPYYGLYADDTWRVTPKLTLVPGLRAYGGNGFVTNPSCQPNSYNERVFPTRINGVRAMGMNNVNGNVSRTFHIAERMNLQTSFLVYNVFNHQGLSGPNATPTSSNFGRVTGDGFPQAGARWLSIQGRLTF